MLWLVVDVVGRGRRQVVQVPVRPIDSRTRARRQAAVNRSLVYSPALIGMEDHPGHVTTADRDRDLQRGGREGSVVMSAHGEPDHPARLTAGQSSDSSDH